MRSSSSSSLWMTKVIKANPAWYINRPSFSWPHARIICVYINIYLERERECSILEITPHTSKSVCLSHLQLTLNTLYTHHKIVHSHRSCLEKLYRHRTKKSSLRSSQTTHLPPQRLEDKVRESQSSPYHTKDVHERLWSEGKMFGNWLKVSESSLHFWMNNNNNYNPYLLWVGEMFCFLVGKMWCSQAE